MKLIIKPSTFAVFLLLVTSIITPLQAKNETLGSLSNEPVNMLEYGMFRLEQYLQSYAYRLQEFNEANIFVNYGEESGKIHILIENRILSSNELMTTCTEQIESIRDKGGVDAELGKITIGNHSLYSTFFFKLNEQSLTIL